MEKKPCNHWYGVVLDPDPNALPEGLWNFTVSHHEPAMVRFKFCPRCGERLIVVNEDV